MSKYEDRLGEVDLSNVNKEKSARAMLSSSEDTYLLLEEAKKINKNIETYTKRDEKINKKRIIDTKQIAGVRFSVMEYDSSYIGDLKMATNIYHAQQLGMRLRSLEVELNQGSVLMESGMFQSSEGNIKLKQSFSPLEIVSGFIRKTNKESFFRPEFMGVGKVKLESNFKFVQLLHVPNATRLVLEKGIYLASAGDWKYKTAKNFDIGSIFFTEKSLLQTELKGAGLVALELPVHPTELTRHTVTEDSPFIVSGQYVLYWTGDLERTVNPAKKILGNMASGRGIVEEYKGRGYVYTAPTLGFYNNIAEDLEGENNATNNPIRDDADMGKRDLPFWKRFFFNR